MCDVDQVHRAAAAVAQPLLSAENFGECSLQITTLGQYVTVAAMAGEQHVLAGQVRTNAHGNRFLAGRQVRKSRNLARSREPLYLLFEQTYPPQCAVHLLPIIQSRCGHVGPYAVVESIPALLQLRIQPPRVPASGDSRRSGHSWTRNQARIT